MMEKSQGWSSFLRQCYVTAAVGINTVGHGCSFGYPSVLLPSLTSDGSRLRAGFTLSRDEASWIASAVTLTMLVGCFLAPSMMDGRGRRVTLLTVAVPALAGWVVAAGATSFGELFASRILLGLALGMSLPLRSVLIGEYTSPKYRGAFLTTVSLSQSTGIFTVHVIGSMLSRQVTALVCAIFPFIALIMAMFSPESPSFLASKGRYDECRKVFRWLRGAEEENELEQLIQARMEFNDIIAESKFSFKESLITLRRKEFYKPVFIMICANVMMQFCGGTTFAAYSTLIIRLVLGDEASANFWMIFLDALRIFVNLLAVYFLNRYNRRTMLVSIGSLCIFSHLALSGYKFGENREILPFQSQWIPIIFLNLQYFTVAAGMVPLPSVIAGEIFPLQYRSIGGSITIICIAVSSFFILKTFPYLTTILGIHGTYLLFSCIISFLLFLIWLTLPETKGKTLQEIEDQFRGKQQGSVEESKKLRELEMQELRKRKISVVSAISLAVDM